MKKIVKRLDFPIECEKYTGFSNSECVFFDIETTGFSPKTTQLYLIGCLFYDTVWNSIQWFCETPNDEALVIHEFFQFISTKKALIHFNGDGFDIPYITQKAQHYQLAPGFGHLISVDIFKYVSGVKKFLKLENYKQKTIERFLGIHRDDQYSGGELINVYQHYCQTGDTQSLDLLLLHNKEDIIGLPMLLPMLSYSGLLNGFFTYESYEKNAEEIIFQCKLHYQLPIRISLGCGDFYIIAYNQTLKIRIKIYPNELKYFYRNYKDYYYLPKEDTAIHKSVAFYVDKDFRTKAKAANCYSRKTGAFIPQFSEILPNYFKIDFSDKKMYIELTDEFLSDSSTIQKYLLDVIKAV